MTHPPGASRAISFTTEKLPMKAYILILPVNGGYKSEVVTEADYDHEPKTWSYRSNWASSANDVLWEAVYYCNTEGHSIVTPGEM